MKKLTTEEKAKRYDDAIKIAKNVHRFSSDLSKIKRMEQIFPELKESEDEQSKKWILEYLHDGLRKSDEQFKDQFKCAIAWLEKQGEKEVSEPKWCHHKVDLSDCSEEYRKAYYDGWNNCNMQHSQCRSELDDVIKCLINGMKFYCEDNEEATWGTDKWSMPVKHIIEVLERHSEQKPYGQRKECSDCQFNYAGERKCSCQMKRNEQKPAWSEDDYVYMKALIDTLKGETTCFTNKDFINWLNSIKDKVQPQTKQKWSKEDERLLNNMVLVIQDYYNKEDAQSLISWLKSLKPQNRWKPSEAQISALEWQVHNTFNNSWQYRESKELLEQLKQL